MTVWLVRTVERSCRVALEPSAVLLVLASEGGVIPSGLAVVWLERGASSDI